MNTKQAVLDIVERWWVSLPPVRQNNNLPAKGAVSGALVVLERLKSQYALDINAHRTTQGQSQIIGVGKAQVRKILARYGESRPFASEAGRTNRGLAGQVARLLDALEPAKLDQLTVNERSEVLAEAQRYLVGKVGEYFNRERVKVAYDSANTAWQAIHDLLESARAVGKEGPVAQYLIGAKLALRFSDLDIRNDSASTQDDVSGSPGDFLVNDTALHVTVALNAGHLEKCQANISAGYRAYVLVPDRMLIGARQQAENLLPGQITTQSIESFVSQNIEELAAFSKGEFVSGFRRLLEIYNERVDRVEMDKSMLVEIPRNLQAP